MTAVVGGRRVAIGNPRFLEGEGVDLEPAREQTEATQAAGSTMIALAMDGEPAGLIAIADPLKAILSFGAGGSLCMLCIIGLAMNSALTQGALAPPPPAPTATEAVPMPVTGPTDPATVDPIGTAVALTSTRLAEAPTEETILPRDTAAPTATAEPPTDTPLPTATEIPLTFTPVPPTV